MEYLFVYGTLLAKAGNNMARFLAANAAFTGNGYFHGRLYQAGDYPGAVLSNNSHEKVYGHIYLVDDPEKVFPVLDTYEEAGPEFAEPNEYIRKKISAFLGDRIISCHVYLYNHPVDGLIQITSGRYPGIPLWDEFA